MVVQKVNLNPSLNLHPNRISFTSLKRIHLHLSICKHIYSSGLYFRIMPHTVLLNNSTTFKHTTLNGHYSRPLHIDLTFHFLIDAHWGRVLTKHGPLEKGMANHSSILALRTL